MARWSTAARGAWLLALAAAPARAQGGGGGAPWAAAAGVRVEAYTFTRAQRVGIREVSLATVPLAADVSLGQGARLAVRGAFASGRLRRADGTEATLRGPTDTELALTLPLAGSWLALTGTAVLPTGQAELSGDELEVAAVVASDLLPFAVPHWGSGGGLGADVALARRFGAVGVGAAAGYRGSREYRAFQDGGAAFRPGSETFARLALSGSLGPVTATLQAGMQRFARDRMRGATLYRSGDRYQLAGSLAFGGGARAGGVLYAGVLHRGAGSRLADPARDLPPQALVQLGAGLRLPVGRGALLPGVDGSALLSRDGAGEGAGMGVGAAAELPAGGVTLVPSARLRVGRVAVAAGARSAFRGVELGLSLRRSSPGR